MGQNPHHRRESVADGLEPAYGQITGPDGDLVVYDPDNPTAWVRSDTTIKSRR